MQQEGSSACNTLSVAADSGRSLFWDEGGKGAGEEDAFAEVGVSEGAVGQFAAVN